MLDGLRVLWDALRDVEKRGYSYIWANLAFVLLCVPVVTTPAAFSALMRVAHAAQTDPSESDLALFWDTFRANLGRAFGWGLLHVVFAIVNFSNLFFYQSQSDLLTGALQSVWLVAGIVWVAVLLYTWPIYYEMAQPSLLGATRNALVMVLQYPFFTLMLLAAMMLLAVISTVFIVAWMLLTVSVFAAIANAAVLDRLRIVRSQVETE